MILICYNLRELKEIFLKSPEILEEIQFNKQYYNEKYKENGMIGILFIFLNKYFHNFLFIIFYKNKNKL